MSHELPTKLSNYFLQLPATERLGFLRHFLQRPEVSGESRGHVVAYLCLIDRLTHLW